MKAYVFELVSEAIVAEESGEALTKLYEELAKQGISFRVNNVYIDNGK